MSKKEILGYVLLPVGVGALFLAIGLVSRGSHAHGVSFAAIALPALFFAWRTLRGEESS